MLFDGWNDLGRILAVGIAGYAGLVLLLRVTGKRTLAKMNAFDLVVTVSFGSTLATLLLSRDVSLAEGLLAFALLCLLQYAVAFTSVRSPRFRELVKSEPTALVLDGRLLADRLRRERVSRDEVLAAVRAQGIASLSQVAAVVLETDGSFSVVRQADGGAGTLANVRGPEPPEH